MIYIVFAPPRQGKTFWVTSLALAEMEKKKPKRVLSNYPILHPKHGFSYKWKMEYIYDVRDSMIIIDEAYRDISSRKHKEFTVDQHTAFATNGHNNNDFWIIAQSPARVDVIVREMCNVFYFVRKKCIPLTKIPLMFIIEGYLDEQNIAMRHSSNDAIYSTEWCLPRRRVKNAYDTHYFGHSEDMEREYERWEFPEGSNMLPNPDRFVLDPVRLTLIYSSLGRHLRSFYDKVKR
jgi:hypothetical protein